MTPLILASGSPRRRAFFDDLGYDYTIVRPDTLERVHPGETAPDYVRRNASEKAAEVFSRHPGSVVVAADTIVVQDGDILEKPKSPDDARRMLRELSGRTHQVMTGICVLGPAPAEPYRDVVVTDVEFKPLSSAEIDAYVATGEPADKAGAYAIQGLAAYMIRAIRGSYTNVVGLPLAEVADALATRFSIFPHARRP
ncbi:MAG: septum formation inhibitor Maf [Kiritimatiellae bacterium]|nr:septum formation inhibitor Maf [Kiritimatiellia bacterium]